MSAKTHQAIFTFLSVVTGALIGSTYSELQGESFFFKLGVAILLPGVGLACLAICSLSMDELHLVYSKKDLSKEDNRKNYWADFKSTVLGLKNIFFLVIGLILIFGYPTYLGIKDNKSESVKSTNNDSRLQVHQDSISVNIVLKTKKNFDLNHLVLLENSNQSFSYSNVRPVLVQPEEAGDSIFWKIKKDSFFIDTLDYYLLDLKRKIIFASTSQQPSN